LSLCFLTISKSIAEIEIITCGDNDNYHYNHKNTVEEGGGVDVGVCEVVGFVLKPENSCLGFKITTIIPYPPKNNKL